MATSQQGRQQRTAHAWPFISQDRRLVGTIGHTAPPGFGPATDLFRTTPPLLGIQRATALPQDLKR